MATLKLTLDKRRSKKNKTYPLVFRVSINGESRDIPIGNSILESEWNTKSESIKKSVPTYDLIAEKIKTLEIKYLGKIMEYERDHPFHLNAQELREFILADHTTNTTVFDFWQKEIENLKTSDRHGCARVYKGVLSILHKCKNLNVSFERIDFNYLKELEIVLISNGVKTNSISVYLRALRRMYNQAVNEKVISYSHYPFRAFRIKKASTVPHPLSLNEMRRYFNINMEVSHRYYESWLLGKLIFLLAGINVADLFQLTEENLKMGRVVYFRSKTNGMISIKLLPEAITILDYFRSKKQATLCGVLSESDLVNRSRLPYVIGQKRKNLNKHLGRISKMMESPVKIRSYIFRYSISNLCKQMGYSIDLISELLGHRYGSNTTSIYLQAYDHDRLDKMHEHVCNEVMR